MTIEEIKRIVISEIINMEDIPLPSFDEIEKCIRKDLTTAIIKNNLEKYLRKFYKNLNIMFYVKYKKHKDKDYNSFYKNGSFEMKNGRPTISINMWAPPIYLDFKTTNLDGISKHILATIAHELVHYKQRISTRKTGSVNKLFADYNSPSSPGWKVNSGQTDDKKRVDYYLHQMERGAFSYQLALLVHRDHVKDLNFLSVLQRYRPIFTNALIAIYDKLKPVEKRQIDKKLSYFRKEFLNQLYKIQQKEKNKS